MRPSLASTVRKLHRGTGVIQLGVDPSRAVLLEFDQPGIARLLELLDGTHTIGELRRKAHSLGLPAEALDTLLEQLTAAGLLRDGRRVLPPELPPKVRRQLSAEADALALRTEPATVLRRRWEAQVIITGDDRIAVPIAAGLAAAGIGHVHTSSTGVVTREDARVGGLLASDRGRPRALAAAEAIRRAAPEHGSQPACPTRPPALVILAGHPAQPPELTALAHARLRTPHLPVIVRDGHVAVGPLVRPGQTACLGCVDVYRTEHDPQWPAIRAQLATSGVRSEPCEAGVAVLAAGYTVVQALVHLDGGEPEILGTTVEWDPQGRSRRRRWRPHPACPCLRRRAGKQTFSRPGTMVQ